MAAPLAGMPMQTLLEVGRHSWAGQDFHRQGVQQYCRAVEFSGRNEMAVEPEHWDSFPALLHYIYTGDLPRVGLTTSSRMDCCMQLLVLRKGSINPPVYQSQSAVLIITRIISCYFHWLFALPFELN